MRPSPTNLYERLRRTDLFRSVFRTGLPRTEREQAQVATTSFLLHLQPAKVHRDSLAFTKTLGLGMISLFLFVILVVTGILLMFYYVPSTARAYEDMKDLQFVVSFGWILRNMHRWAAHAMVASVFLHLGRVFYTAAYKKPREFNWVVGVGLLVLTLVLSFTGYLLPWDQLAYWAITVGTSIASYAPVVGKQIRFLLVGGSTIGQNALLRFYVLHVMVLPLVLVFFAAVHLWRVRKDGGLARPKSGPDVEEAPSVPTKTYGLMALVKGSSSQVGQRPEEEVFTWPRLILRETILFVAVVCVLLALSLAFNAPLEERANPVHPTNPAKAPWYFLGLQELVSYSALWGGVIVPGLLLSVLIVLPYLDASPKGVGVWFSRDRKAALVVFTVFVVAAVAVTVLGVFFRGPNWSFVVPWRDGLFY